MALPKKHLSAAARSKITYAQFNKYCNALEALVDSDKKTNQYRISRINNSSH